MKTSLPERSTDGRKDTGANTAAIRNGRLRLEYLHDSAQRRWLDLAVSSDKDNSMNMIGHDDECIQLNSREAVSKPKPSLLDEVASIVQLHDTIDDFTETVCAIVHHGGNQVA